MPTTIFSLTSQFGFLPQGPIRWGESIPSNKPGIYFISISNNHKIISSLPNAPINLNIIQKWIDRVPHLTLDKRRPSAKELAERISRFWLSDETILYIGQTTSQTLNDRINDFYNHMIGDSGPHRGGYWLKTLDILR